ncbi:MAG: isoprenylcysteine carboxylmethyltransferase family protein [Pseudomonadota bacterium]
MLAHFFRQHSFKNHLLVCLQFSGISLSCYPVGLKNNGHILWLVLCAIGAAIGIWALCFNKVGNFSVYPEIKTHAKLITNGPYKFIRHPMYSALIIMMIGIALYNFHLMNLFGVTMVIFAVISKANEEEKLLLIKFPEYDKYQSSTKRFFPYIY